MLFRMLMLPPFCLLVSYLAVVSSAVAIDERGTKIKIQHGQRDAAAADASQADPVVDLGYAVYEGYYDETTQLNVFKGIRYAAPPLGKLRWQRPQAPAVNRNHTLPAKSYPPHCPQGFDSPMPSGYVFPDGGVGNEDCLFLSVFQPKNAVNLPVMVWIHGGGYGSGAGDNDMSEMVVTNNHGFIVVLIQYRLGAFGFLSSAEVAQFGTPNAGLYDMLFSLQWVQKHIRTFGGDPSRVTVSGESAGAGGVMLLSMAFGGSLGTALFNNAIVASPYLPGQWDYDDDVPSQFYRLFAQEVGCLSESLDMDDSTVFECLQAKDTLSLQNASLSIGSNTKYGQWAFLPVTDGDILRKRPSEQLLAGEVNGVRMLSGHNANEGAMFVPQGILTSDDFDAFIQDLFPLMDEEDLSRIAEAYAIPPTTPGPLYSTLGDSGPTALNQSGFGTGQQQRANNLYAETAFVCTSYWLASAFPTAWKYQYSVPPAQHGADLDAYYTADSQFFGEGTLSPGFRTAMQEIWGRFIMDNDPTLPASAIKKITTASNGSATGDDITAAGTGSWPVWSGGWGFDQGYQMLNLNMTGGHPVQYQWYSADGHRATITEYAGPGLTAKFDIVDAWSWEGGRGRRCQLWADMGALVPE